MLKKILNIYIIISIVLPLNIPIIFAEEKEVTSNTAIDSEINDMIREIYDSKEQYEDLAGEYVEKATIVYNATSDAYWWPIGSTETTESNGKTYARGEPESTVITSYFGYRGAVIGSDGAQISGGRGHGALDIANMTGPGKTNVIASKSGVVVYPTAGAPTNCPYSTSGSSCGGGYGNYVIIQHSDGNYTLYAHLHENTITVKAGDSVEQGQVIAKMGSSGNSTGTHLHFEVREGQNASSAKVDPLDYVSMDNPRPVNASSQLMEFLEFMEGHTEIIGDSYLVVNIGDGVRTVGAGVTLENNPGYFSKYGLNINNYPVGSTIPIAIVDQIKNEIVNDMRSDIEAELARNSITLEPHQVDALISQKYNIGNIVGFCSAYKKYGNTQELYNNWFFRAVNRGTIFEGGLTRRRNAEWKMFHEGIYDIG